MVRTAGVSGSCTHWAQCRWPARTRLEKKRAALGGAPKWGDSDLNTRCARDVVAVLPTIASVAAHLWGAQGGGLSGVAYMHAGFQVDSGEGGRGRRRLPPHRRRSFLSQRTLAAACFASW